MPRFVAKEMDFGEPSLFLPQRPVFFAYALMEHKPYFPARDLNLRFKSLAAYGFFRKGVWGKALFSPEKRAFPKKMKKKAFLGGGYRGNPFFFEKRVPPN